MVVVSVPFWQSALKVKFNFSEAITAEKDTVQWRNKCSKKIFPLENCEGKLLEQNRAVCGFVVDLVRENICWQLVV